MYVKAHGWGRNRVGIAQEYSAIATQQTQKSGRPGNTFELTSTEPHKDKGTAGYKYTTKN